MARILPLSVRFPLARDMDRICVGVIQIESRFRRHLWYFIPAGEAFTKTEALHLIRAILEQP